MSDLLSAIRDDINEYKRLCDLYGEQVQYSRDNYGIEIADCYGEHAKSLKKRKKSKDMGVKEHVINNQKVFFDFYRNGILYYKTEKGLLFEVPISEAGDAVFLKEDKAILFMRYIRKQIEANEAGKAECEEMAES